MQSRHCEASKDLKQQVKVQIFFSFHTVTHFVSARSPLVGHINATLEGLTTIRAFRAEEFVSREFDKHQDNYTCAIFTSQMIFTAFDFFMSMLTCLPTVIVIVRFLFFEHGKGYMIEAEMNQVFFFVKCTIWSQCASTKAPR